jgi:hypothetical protein
MKIIIFLIIALIALSILGIFLTFLIVVIMTEWCCRKIAKEVGKQCLRVAEARDEREGAEDRENPFTQEGEALICKNKPGDIRPGESCCFPAGERV